MAAQYVRKNRGPDTAYMQFKKVHSQRATADGDAVTDADTGRSPVSRWLAYAFDYDDVASNAAETAMVVNLTIPRGTLILDCIVRTDVAWTSVTDVDIGDSNQSAGWLDGMNPSASVASGPLFFRDANAVYVDKTSDISAGSTGAQYYVNGGVVVVNFKTAQPTAGEMIVFLETISYNEPIRSEWT